MGLRLPAALREWYERYGAMTDVWSLQDRLLPPTRFRVGKGMLTFCIENQNVVEWAIRLRDVNIDDPAVLIRDPRPSDEWHVESETISAFALQFAVMNAKWSRAVQYSADGQATNRAVSEIARTYARLPFADSHWPPLTRFYGAQDLLIETSADTWIWIVARTESALRDATDSLEGSHIHWENFSCPKDG